jgi:hypothetical protein
LFFRGVQTSLVLSSPLLLIIISYFDAPCFFLLSSL